MREVSLFTPMTPSTPHRDSNLARRLYDVLHAPARWLEARRDAAALEGLGEREWSDIGAGPRDLGEGYFAEETADERAARKRAIRAWYGEGRRRAA